MPKDLYVSDSVSLEFDSEGIITSFNAYLYGKDNDDKLESYLITYDKNNSKNITIILNGYVNIDYNEDKRIEPLINTMKVIPLKKHLIIGMRINMEYFITVNEALDIIQMELFILMEKVIQNKLQILLLK